MHLAQSPGLRWQDRAQFMNIATQAMRRILVDPARTNGARQRGGGLQRASLTGGEPDLETPNGTGLDVLDLNDKPEALRASHEHPAQVVEMRFFGGLSFEETGHVLVLSPRTLQADRQLARAWLAVALKSHQNDRSS